METPGNAENDKLSDTIGEMRRTVNSARQATEPAKHIRIVVRRPHNIVMDWQGVIERGRSYPHGRAATFRALEKRAYL